jgi:hypothetical protein
LAVTLRFERDTAATLEAERDCSVTFVSAGPYGRIAYAPLIGSTCSFQIWS